MKILFTHTLGDMVADYIELDDGAAMALRLLPQHLAQDPACHDFEGQFRENFTSLIEFKLTQTPYCGQFNHGYSLAGASEALEFIEQTTSTPQAGIEIRTRFKAQLGLQLTHVLAWTPGQMALRAWVEAEQTGSSSVSIELLSSFSLSGISPFVETVPNAVFSMKGPRYRDEGRFRLHRYRSQWANEGFLESIDFEDILLEPAFLPGSRPSEKFGQVGSMPVRRFFPWVAVEDSKSGIVWGAQLEAPASWQLEVARETTAVFINGGLADRDTGHWLKNLAPGEQFTTPTAYLSCVSGSVDEISQRLLTMQESVPVPTCHAIEKELPIVCNEWCSSWGIPSHENMQQLADTLLAKSQAKVLVIDAGWYQPVNSAPGAWASAQGDWIPNPDLFPQGIAHTAQAIRERGLIPGLWFELEVCGILSSAYTECTHLFLQRDGVPLTVGKRRFWDMTLPETRAYLRERVIGTLKEGSFGYLKIDYNDSIGIGAEGTESLGEKLRQNILASQDFIREIQSALPELIIENCSSGGHRLEPSFLNLTDQSSFSDAHETVEIPIIAADLQHIVAPRKSQIWAVLRKEDSLQRIHYSMTAALLGRLCISGDLNHLSDEQWALVQAGETFYQKAAPIIREGRSTIFRHTNKSRRAPTGWQAVLRKQHNSENYLLVVHQFGIADTDTTPIQIPLPEVMVIKNSYTLTTLAPSIENQQLQLNAMPAFSAAAFILTTD